MKSSTPITSEDCPDCSRPIRYCVCVYRARCECAERREAEAVAEAYYYRRLWQAAAACLEHNDAKIKPRGPDERAVLELAQKADTGPLFSGKTTGWITELQG